MSSHKVLIAGSLLVDYYLQSQKRYPGGGSFNTAWHLQHLEPGSVDFVTRLGKDEAGNWLIDFANSQGFPTEGIKQDKRFSTAENQVVLDRLGVPQYTFPVREPASVHLQLSDFSDLQSYNLFMPSTALLQSPVSYPVLRQLMEKLPSKTHIFWDMNLRKGRGSDEFIPQMLAKTHILKLNSEELSYLRERFDFKGTYTDSLRQIKEQFGVLQVFLTSGAEISYAISHDGVLYTEKALKIDCLDSVGAGDAFSAVILQGLLRRWTIPSILKKANFLAAKVCQIRGAIPLDANFYVS